VVAIAGSIERFGPRFGFVEGKVCEETAFEIHVRLPLRFGVGDGDRSLTAGR
jgi:hypothetical protein